MRKDRSSRERETRRDTQLSLSLLPRELVTFCLLAYEPAPLGQRYAAPVFSFVTSSSALYSLSLSLSQKRIHVTIANHLQTLGEALRAGGQRPALLR